jgi:plastocyanin
MTRHARPIRSLRRTQPVWTAVSLALLLAGSALLGWSSQGASATTVRPADGVAFVNVSATTAFSFDPSQFTVVAGQSVHFKFTQLAATAHTFVLSPIANFAFVPTNTTADLVHFFEAHAPLVNLSLGTTTGSSVQVVFTAPVAGTYEFVCVIKDHFQGGMHGQMVSNAPGSNPPPATSTPSMTTTYLVIAAVAVVVVIVAAAALMMRKPKSPA